MNKYKVGDKVKVNGNNEAIIHKIIEPGYYEVRLFHGVRFVGETVKPESDIQECDS